MLHDQSAMLRLLGRADFGWTQDIRSVWRDAPGHVSSLHAEIARRLMEDFATLSPPPGAPPLGRVIQGQQGSGKTHLLGTLRRMVWDQGGWFVTIEVAGEADFWDTAALGFVAALGRATEGGLTQGERVLQTFGRLRPPPAGPLRRLLPSRAAARGLTGHIADLVRVRDPEGAVRHRDVIAAFVALCATTPEPDPERRELADAWLRGLELDAPQRRAVGVLRPRIAGREAVMGLSWILSLAGPSMCVIDQIDAVIGATHAQAGEEGRRRAALHELAAGLMDLRDVAQRTLVVVSTLEQTWDTLSTQSVASFPSRFIDPFTLRAILQPDTARELIERRLAPAYAASGLTPPYPAWPFHTAAFAGATGFTPRELLKRCRAHLEGCVTAGTVRELETFAAPRQPEIVPPLPVPPDLIPPSPVVDAVEARYEHLRATLPAVNVTDEADLAGVLLAALHAWMRQRGEGDPGQAELNPDPSMLTARVTTPDRVVSFRVITHAAGQSVLPRLRGALTASGIGQAAPGRALIAVRADAWPTGNRTEAAVREFEALGGRRLIPDYDDLRRFAALRALLREPSAELDQWLRHRRPMDESPFLQATGLVASPVTILAPLAGEGTPSLPPLPLAGEGRGEGIPAPSPVPSPPHPHPLPQAGEGIPSLLPPPPGEGRGEGASPQSTTPAIPLGHRARDKTPVTLPLTLLPRHLAVFAGAGSGKTVLLRRIAEEAVLAGIPVIMLDSNNDLVRMADPWPEPPFALSGADLLRAARFAATADVVVWTPGRASGNPLSLAPLPDFGAFAHDADELAQAVEVAAGAIEPLIVPRPSSDRAALQTGVLRDALRHFARAGGATLPALIDLLADLPPETSAISRAQRIAADLADKLRAALSRNPLLIGGGAPLDPRLLLTGAHGRTRVSVVNFAGLATEEARQDFAGRLMMALFAHIKRHPAGPAHPVCGLLIIDEAHLFAPSARGTPSKAAAIALARQARKYGLGLVFATQGPKDIDNGIVSNCTTRLFGRLNAPATIAAAREMLSAAGGTGDDIGRLIRGEFYLVTEGLPAPVRIETPLCLTHHPANPPTEDDVLARAARSRQAA